MQKLRKWPKSVTLKHLWFVVLTAADTNRVHYIPHRLTNFYDIKILRFFFHLKILFWFDYLSHVQFFFFQFSISLSNSTWAHQRYYVIIAHMFFAYCSLRFFFYQFYLRFNQIIRRHALMHFIYLMSLFCCCWVNFI